MTTDRPPMELEPQERRRIVLSSIAAALLLLAGIVSYRALVVPEIDAAFRGESHSYWNRLFAEHAERHPERASLSHYQHRGRVWLTRAVLLLLAAQLGCIAYIGRRTLQAGAARFFGEVGSPYNLAIFRIVFFITLFLLAGSVDSEWFSTLPAALEEMPFGSGWLAPWLPLSGSATGAAVVLLQVACIAGALGIYTRSCALAAGVLAFYVLGVPQFFGKVNHYHHMLWFAFLLAASRSGDVHSIDAALAARRRADRGILDPPAPAVAYALPLRAAWLLIGVMYFFPGFWKLWSCGIDWAFSDNMQYQLYWSWESLGGWLPFVRIDRWPFLCWAGGAGTILFEMSFVALIFSRRLRPFAVAAGLMFHTSVYLLFHISFWTLACCYVVFIDWRHWLEALGRFLFGAPLAVLYDGNCRLCRRTMAAIRTFDLLGTLRPVNALDDEAVRGEGLAWIDLDARIRDMHAVAGERADAGYEAYRAIARRIPLLWPLVPVLALPPVAAIGRRVYRRVADTRVCTAPPPPAPAAIAPPVRWVRAVALLLFAGGVAAGAGHVVMGWPFACYPTFDAMRTAERTTLAVEFEGPGGEFVALDAASLRGRLTAPRWRGLLSSILLTEQRDLLESKLQAFWQLSRAASEDPRLDAARTVRCYRDTITVVPEESGRNPLSRQLLLEFTPVSLPRAAGPPARRFRRQRPVSCHGSGPSSARRAGRAAGFSPPRHPERPR